ncbi:MAG: TIM-barrel domain-containing protein [Pseudomonadota bacterium]
MTVLFLGSLSASADGFRAALSAAHDGEREPRFEVSGGFLSEGVARLIIAPSAQEVPRPPLFTAYGDGEADGRQVLADVVSSTDFDPALCHKVNENRFEGLGLAFVLDPSTGTLAVQQRVDGAWLEAARDRIGGGYQYLPDRAVFRHYQARAYSTAYFGLGDKTGRLNRARRRYRSLQTDALGYDAERSDPLYKHAPFFIERRADGTCLGVLYETLDEIDIDLGSEHSNYFEPFRLVETRGAGLAVTYIAGPTMGDVVRRFTALTGRQAMPPRWAFGFAFSAMGQTDAEDGPEQIAQFAEACSAHEIPLSAIHFGSGYSMGDDGLRYVFEWNRRRYPDPAGLLSALKDKGLRLCANVKPVLLTGHPAFETAEANGWFVRRADGGPALERFWDGIGAQLDFTNPDTVAWWQTRLTKDILETGFDGVWNDNNEAELWDEHATVHGTDAPAMAVRPAHALLMTKASRDAAIALRPNERPHMISRAGPIGLARYGETWTGDNDTSWHTLKWNLRQGLSMGLTGMAMVGHDVGGFSGPVPGPELLTRWFQMMALHPRAVMNSWKPTLPGGTNLPFMHVEATPHVRAALNLRMQFLPLLYALAYQASRTGDPIIRPLLYEFADAVEESEQDVFLLGPDVLVAPVVSEDTRQVTITLPGTGFDWIDFQGLNRHRAGTTAALDAPLDRLPILVREGGVAPLASNWDLHRPHDAKAIEFRAYPTDRDGEGTAHVLLDDGLLPINDDVSPDWHAVTVRWRDGIVSADLPANDRCELTVCNAFTD